MKIILTADGDILVDQGLEFEKWTRITITLALVSGDNVKVYRGTELVVSQQRVLNLSEMFGKDLRIGSR